jgi:hypothetical protein
MSLTNEDRAWILEQFAASAARTAADMADVKTSLTADVAEVKASLTADMANMKASLIATMEGRMDALEERLKDFVRQSDHDLETKIIGEFWKWSRTSDMRTKQAIESTNTLSERLLAIEDRITALERRPS